MDIQRQIRNNATAQQDAFKDLYTWEEEISKKDDKLKKLPKPSKENLPPVRGTSTTLPVSAAKPSPAPNTKPASTTTPTATVQSTASKSSTPKTSTSTPSQPSDPSKKKAAELKDKGNDFFKRGKYEDAIKCYTESAELDNSNILPLANRAMAYIHLQRYEKAEVDCNTVLAMDPNFAKAYFRRGTARMNLKKYQEAIDDFQQLLTLEPGNKDAIDALSKIDKILHPPKAAPSPATSSSTTDSGTKKPRKVAIQEVEEEKPATTQAPSTPKSAPTTAPLVSVVPTSTTAPISATTTSAPSTTSRPTTPPSKASTPAKRTFQIQVEIPTEPPKTLYEFEAFWNNVKNNPETFSKYFKIIPPANLPKLFQTSLNSEILSSIITILDQYYSDDLDALYEVLRHLVEISRFDMNIMFLSRKEKEIIAGLFDKLLAAKPEQASSLQALKTKYGIKS